MATLKGQTIAASYQDLVKRADSYSQPGTNIELMTDTDSTIAPTGLYLESGATTSNVGIGTASPGNLLEVASSTTHAGVEINADTDFDPFIQFSEGGTTRADIAYESTANDFRIRTIEAGSTISLMGGNVGIGTAAPDAPINVESAITTSSFDGDDADCLAIFQNTQDTDNGGGSYIKLDSTRAGENMGIVWNSQDDNDSRFVFVDNRGGNGYQRMAFDNNGKVGIGTDAPAAILHVKGAESKIVMEETDADKIALISSGDGDFLVQANSGVSNDNRLVVYKTSADVKVSAGNLVIGTNGKGIDFSANTSDAGGMTAEILDDYEEGTWTPVLGGQGGTSGQSYGNQNGTYTKVGRSVTCCFYVNMTTKGTITGDLHILGLPFTCGSGKRSAAALGYIDKFTLTADHFIVNYVEQSNTAIFLQEAEGEGDNVANLSTSNVEDNTQLMGSVTYFI